MSKPLKVIRSYCEMLLDIPTVSNCFNKHCFRIIINIFVLFKKKQTALVFRYSISNIIDLCESIFPCSCGTLNQKVKYNVETVPPARYLYQTCT